MLIVSPEDPISQKKRYLEYNEFIYIYIFLSNFIRVLHTVIWYQVFWEFQKENSEFKPIKLNLKIDIMLHPASVEGLINGYIQIIFKQIYLTRR